MTQSEKYSKLKFFKKIIVTFLDKIIKNTVV